MVKALWLLVLVGSLGACVSDEFDPGTEGQNPDELSSTEQALTASCTPSAILAATPLSRRAIIERGLRWVSLRIMYSQSRAFEGYRQDCSGFTSMSWGLPRPGPTTFVLAPASRTYSHTIGWDELLPGDALNDPSHHVMVFAGWLDARHTTACILQENATGTPANLSARTRSTLGGYYPIRFNHLPPGTSETAREPRCPARGVDTVCLDHDTVIHCNDGYVTARSNCTGGASLCSSAGVSAARCLSPLCVASASDAPVAHDICLADGRIARCTSAGVPESPHACPSMNVCRRDASGAARCVLSLPPPPSDAGATPPPPADDAGAPPPSGEDDAGATPPPSGSDDAGPGTDPASDDASAPAADDDASAPTSTGDAGRPRASCAAGGDAGCDDGGADLQAGESMDLPPISGGCHTAPVGRGTATPRGGAALALLGAAAAAVVLGRQRRRAA